MISSRFSTWAFVLLLVASLILVGHLLFSFITPVVMATVIVSLFSPIHQRLARALRDRQYLAASISTLIVFLCVLIPLALLLISLVQQGLNLVQATQRLTASGEISKWIASLRYFLDVLNSYLASINLSISSDRIVNLTTTLSQAIGHWIYNGIGLIAANLLSVALNFFLTIALVFVFFVSGAATKRFVMEIVPLPDDEKERLAKRFRELAEAVFLGNGLISLLEGILGGISLALVGIPGALLWGVVMAIAAFLPVIGASIVVIPAGMYLLLIGHTWPAAIFLLFNIVQMSVLETLIKPRLIGTKSQMHAVLVFMSIIAGVQLYGVFGLFYGPLLVTLFLALAEIYKEHYRENLLRY